MSDYLEQMSAAVAQLTAEGAPFATTNVDIVGVSYRSYTSLPENMGGYFRFMLNHADKEFAVYQGERYTFGEAWGKSNE